MLPRLCVLVVLALAPFAEAARAQDYPRRPVTIIAPFPAGSVTDGMARVVAESLARSLKQNVLVENKPGQEGAVAGRAAARAEPDGYTILIGGNSTHSAAVNLYNLPYDPVADFAVVGGVSKIPLLLVVRADFPAKDLAAFVALARDPAKKLSFGSGATSTRAAGELLRVRAGFELVNVPYRGIPAAVTDVLGGRIDGAFADPATVLGMVQEGKLRAIAVTSARRIAKLPDVPTIAESGFPGFEVVPWLALFAPAKTPPEIVARLSAALEQARRDEHVRNYIAQVASDLYQAGPAEVAAYLSDDIKRWSEVVRSAGIEKN